MEKFNCNPSDFPSANQDLDQFKPKVKPNTDPSADKGENGKLPGDSAHDPKVAGSTEAEGFPGKPDEALIKENSTRLEILKQSLNRDREKWVLAQAYINEQITQFRAENKDPRQWVAATNQVLQVVEGYNVIGNSLDWGRQYIPPGQVKDTLDFMFGFYRSPDGLGFLANPIGANAENALKTIGVSAENAQNFINGCKDKINQLSEYFEGAAEAYALMNQYFAAINSLILAVCQAIEAVFQLAKHLEYLFKNIQELLWKALKDALLSLVPRNLWLRSPKPLSMFLAEVQGLLNNINGFGQAVACFNKFFKNSDGTSSPSPAMIPPEAIATLGAIASGSLDVGEKWLKIPSNEELESRLDALKPAAFGGPADAANKKGKVALQSPPPLVSLPENSAFVPGVAALLLFFNAIPSSAFAALGGVRASEIADPNTGQAAVPGKQIANSFKLLRVIGGSVLSENEKINAMTAAANGLAPVANGNPTEADKLAALQAILNAGIVIAATANYAVSPDGEPSRSAIAHEACADAHDTSVLDGPDTPEKLADEINSQKPGTAANNSLMQTSGTTSAKDFIQNAPGNMVNPAAETDYKAALGSFAQPDGNSAFEDLPVLLLLTSFSSEHALFQQFKNLNFAIGQEQTVHAEANRRLLSEARQQGRLSNSPYTYLALLADALGEQDLNALVFDFLRYDPAASAKIIGISKFWESLASLDPNAPMPELSDYPDALKAAERSYQYVQALGTKLEGLTPLILNLRTTARQLGGPAGFEHMVAGALTTAAIRIQAEIAKGNFAEATRIAGIAEKMKQQHLTNPEYMVDFKPFLDGEA